MLLSYFYTVMKKKYRSLRNCGTSFLISPEKEEHTS